MERKEITVWGMNTWTKKHGLVIFDEFIFGKIVETRHTREGVSSQREIAAHVLMRQAKGLKRKEGIIMKVFDEMYFNDILRTAWSGAVDTAERISEEEEESGDDENA